MRVYGMLRPGVADALTIGNALCGAAALGVVMVTPEAADLAGEVGVLRIVALLVLTGVVLDICDGAVARALGGTPLGQHLDSLGDVVTFGVAPAVAVGALAARHSSGWETAALALAVLAYVAAAVIRLADFDAGRSGDHAYTGMPSPLAAVTALSVGLLSLAPWLTAAGIALTAWMMVSGIRFPHSRGKVLVADAAGLFIGTLGVIGLIEVRVTAALAVVGCMVVSPVAFAMARRRGDTDAPLEVPVARAEP